MLLRVLDSRESHGVTRDDGLRVVQVPGATPVSSAPRMMYCVESCPWKREEPNLPFRQMGSDHAIGGHRTFKSAGTLYLPVLRAFANSHVCVRNVHADEAIP